MQDYQLQLLPGQLRDQRPDLRIGFFLHIPFPPVELFLQLPWREQIVRGLLGADLVGFHTPGGARNFRRLATQLAGATAAGQGGVGYRERTVKLGAFPISIDYAALDELSRTPEVIARAAKIRSELGDPRRLILGVDRLDYTKGIDVRLRAFEELLDEERVSADDTVFLQIATPSRERVEHYIRLRAEIEQTVGRINGDARPDRPSTAALPAPVAAPRGADGVLPGRGRHAGHPAARRDEPRGEGVHRLPPRRRRRAGAVGVHRGRARADERAAGEPARHRRGEGGGLARRWRCRATRRAGG